MKIVLRKFIKPHENRSGVGEKFVIRPTAVFFGIFVDDFANFAILSENFFLSRLALILLDLDA